MENQNCGRHPSPAASEDSTTSDASLISKSGPTALFDRPPSSSCSSDFCGHQTTPTTPNCNLAHNVIPSLPSTDNPSLLSSTSLLTTPAAGTSGEMMNVTLKSHIIDDPHHPSEKLNNQDILLLEGLNERKARIDQQVQFLSNLPKIYPYDPLPPHHSKISRKVWQSWWAEHDRIEREAEIFRADEFASMKKVAMSKTSNMSREDTELVGMALGTLEAFSKLEHLLRSRRNQLKILDLRMKWDHQTRKVWQDVHALRAELPQMLSKLQWSPPSYLPDFTSPCTCTPTSSPQLSQRPSTLTGSSSHPSSNETNQQELKISPPRPSAPAKLKTASIDSHNQRLLNPTSNRHPLGIDIQTNVQQANVENPVSRITSSSSALFTPPQLPHNFGQSFTPPGVSHFESETPIPFFRPKRSTSGTSRSILYPSRPSSISSLSSNPSGSPSISAQSRSIRIQSISLQLSSLTTRFHTLSRCIGPTSCTIDQLIDSGLHVPEVFLDEQDRLEASVRELQSEGPIKFFNRLLDQYKEADEIWFTQRDLESEIRQLQIEIESDLSSTNQLNFLRYHQRSKAIYERLLQRCEVEKTRAAKLDSNERMAPTNRFYPEQPQLNQTLVKALRWGYESVQKGLEHLKELMRLYDLAITALERSVSLKTSMTECKETLTTLSDAIAQLDEQHPYRPWELLDPKCLQIRVDEEAAYQENWKRIEDQALETCHAGIKLSDHAGELLIDLNARGIDPNIKTEVDLIRQGMRLKLLEVQKTLGSRVDSMAKLSSIRSLWAKIAQAQITGRSLRARLLDQIDQERWRINTANIVQCRDDENEVMGQHIAEKNPKREPVSSPGRELPLSSLSISAIDLFTSYQEAHAYLIDFLEPEVQSISQKLTLPRHHALNRFIKDTLCEFIDQTLPDLMLFEQLVQQARLQASQIKEIETEAESKFLEASIMIQKIQDLIGNELDPTCNGEPSSPELLSPSSPELRRRLKSQNAVIRADMEKLVQLIEQFSGSLPNRVQMLASICSQKLINRGDGNGDEIMVLDCLEHDDLVRRRLNQLSMRAMGLRDQMVNEYNLLAWVHCDSVATFETCIEQVKHDLSKMANQLDDLERHFHSFTSMMEMDHEVKYMEEKQVEINIRIPIDTHFERLQLVQAKFDKSISQELEKLIASCPSHQNHPTRSFQPDQFFRSKQMSCDQLQSLINQHSNKMETVKQLGSKFVDTVNYQRKTEFEWRESWEKVLNDVSYRLQTRSSVLDQVQKDAHSIQDEFNEWLSMSSQKRISDLYDLIEMSDYSTELSDLQKKWQTKCLDETKYLGDSSRSDFDQVERVLDEMMQRLPHFDNKLAMDVSVMIEAFQRECDMTLQSCDQIAAMMEASKQGLNDHLLEFQARRAWSSQCLDISENDILALGRSVAEFVSTTQRLAQGCSHSFSNTPPDRTKIDNLAIDDSRLFCLSMVRAIFALRSANLVTIQQDLEIVGSKIATISHEIEQKSQSNVEHRDLTSLSRDFQILAGDFADGSQTVSRVEGELLNQLQALEIESELALASQQEEGWLADLCERERDRLRWWGQHDLQNFIQVVNQEVETVDSLEVRYRSDDREPDFASQSFVSERYATNHFLPKPYPSPLTSSCFEEQLKDARFQVERLRILAESVSQTRHRLTGLDNDQKHLKRQINLFTATLPLACHNQLQSVLRGTQFPESKTETKKQDAHGFETASLQLPTLNLRLQHLSDSLNQALNQAQSELGTISKQKSFKEAISNISKHLDRLDLDRWIDSESQTSHSLLPTRMNLTEATSQLEKIQEEHEVVASDLLAVGEWTNQVSVKLQNKFSQLEPMRELVAFEELVAQCDQAFSTLLNALDEIPAYQAGGKAVGPKHTASASWAKLREVGTALGKDLRVDYQISRLSQTWKELTEIIRDQEQSQRSSQTDQVRSTAHLELPNSGIRSSRNHGPLTTPVSRLKPSKIPTLRENMSPQHINRPNSEIGFLTSPVVGSPSYMISRRGGRRSLDNRSATPTQRRPSLNRDANWEPPDSHEPKQPHGLSSSLGKSSSRQKLRVVLDSTHALDTASPLSARTALPGVSCWGNRDSSTRFTDRAPAHYTPQPNRNIDEQVGKVVNQLAVNVHIAPAEGWEDNSGLYWIGEKIYFCRILRSQTVMVRVGGGWNELSRFLLEHSKQDRSCIRPEVERILDQTSRQSFGNHLDEPIPENQVLSTSQEIFPPRSETRLSVRSNQVAGSMVREQGAFRQRINSNVITPIRSRRISQASAPGGRPPPSSHSLASSTIMTTPPEAIQMFLRKAENRGVLPTSERGPMNSSSHSTQPTRPPSSSGIRKSVPRWRP